MANAALRNGSGVWIGTEAGVVTTKAVWVKDIIFYCHDISDVCTIYNGGDTYQTIPILTSSTAKNTVIVHFSGKKGKLFPQGLFLHTITVDSMVGIVLRDNLLPS